MANTDTSQLRNQLARQNDIPSPDLTPHGSYLPAPNEWSTISQMAIVLAKSQLVPAAYRNKPENVIVATMTGRRFGWDPMMAMLSFHIIEGRPSLMSERFLALVRQAGHSVSGESSSEGATVTGKRRDTGDTHTATFTMDDARRAGLAGKDVWKKYPADMCWARALTAVCRRLFSDVTLGVSYTPEELDEAIDVGLVEVEGPDPRIVELKDRARDLNGEQRAEFGDWFNTNEMTYRSPVHLAAIQAKLNELEREPNIDDVVDELVRDGFVEIVAESADPPREAAPRVDDARGAAPVDRPTTAANRKLFACLNTVGILGDDDRHEYASATLGRPVTTFKDLSVADTDKLITKLEALPATKDQLEDLAAGLRDGGILGPQRFSWSGARISRSIRNFGDLTCGEASTILFALERRNGQPDGGDAA